MDSTMIPRMYVVCGASGVGKSTVLPKLRNALSAEHYVIHDGDERGVPDGAPETWRLDELKHWVEVSAKNAELGISTVICGYAQYRDFRQIDVPNAPEIKMILLHAGPDVVRKRLEGRHTYNGVFDENQKIIGMPFYEFVDLNVRASAFLSNEFSEENGTIIDTTEKTPEEVAEKVVDVISVIEDTADPV